MTTSLAHKFLYSTNVFPLGLKSIDVLFETSASRVSAKTIYDKKEQSWWVKLANAWGGHDLKMEINYVVKVPMTNSIHLSNDYGSITLDKIQGNAEINCDYAQIIIGELLNCVKDGSTEIKLSSVVPFLNSEPYTKIFKVVEPDKSTSPAPPPARVF